MNQSIIDEFFTEECDLSVRQMLVQTIENFTGQDVIREYAFNRFNLRISFEEEIVIIEDDLMPGEEGECEISLSEFESKLREV